VHSEESVFFSNVCNDIIREGRIQTGKLTQGFTSLQLFKRVSFVRTVP